MPSIAQTKVKSKNTLDFMPIEEIRDGVVILTNGSFVSVLASSSLNFALKSEDEQRAIISQYQNFLNGLDFSCQFYIQSRRLDIRPYLATLEDRIKEQTNDLLKVQTREYIKFVKGFTDATNIMKKTFYVVVPYTPSVLTQATGGGGFLSKLFKRGTDEENVSKKLAAFEETRAQLEQRVASVSQGLMRTGVRVETLGTEALVELFYKIFNPNEQESPIVG
ncbi:MAG: hypothetical protein AAB682_01785 [Patescibacteria group bacterium]